MKTKNKYLDLFITFEELYYGCEKELNFKKFVPCFSCLFSSSSSSSCETCSNQGATLDISSLASNNSCDNSCDNSCPLILCKHCHGSGQQQREEKKKSYDMSSTCNRCNDFGIISKDEKLTIKIIPGKHYPDDLIHFVCMNNEQPGMLTGDVIVKICVKLHPYFEVFSTSRCSDLVYKCYLDEVKDTGRDKKTVNLTTLCGHVLNINIDSIGIDSIGIDSIISNESSSLTELIGEYGLWNKNGISRGKLYIRYY